MKLLLLLIVFAANLIGKESVKPNVLFIVIDDAVARWDRSAITTYDQGNHPVRSEHHRYVRYADGSQELYDHRKDPNEWTKLASNFGVREIIDEHVKWLPKNNIPDATSKTSGQTKRSRGK